MWDKLRDGKDKYWSEIVDIVRPARQMTKVWIALRAGDFGRGIANWRRSRDHDSRPAHYALGCVEKQFQQSRHDLAGGADAAVMRAVAGR